MINKVRQVPFTSELAYEVRFNPNWATPGSVWTISKAVRKPYSFTQRTQTESHGWPIRPGRAEFNVGGDFSTRRLSFYNFTPQTFVSENLFGSGYSGPAFPVNMTTRGTDAFFDQFVPFSSNSVLDQKGATAIARCIPTNSVSDAATFIGELKAGLPKMVGRELFKTKLKDYRKVGSEYLNVEFGWKPLISDLENFGKAAIDSEKIISQLHRDSGRLVRRRYSFPDEISTSATRLSDNAYCWVPTDGGLSTYLYRPGPVDQVVTTTVKTWFSGAFTYHVNLGSRIQDKLDRHAAEARKLFGLELTPEVAWNLAPWSWAVDWEGNIGDVLHNLSAFSQDGLVMPYGYIMQEKHVVIDHVMYGGIQTGRTEPPLRVRWEATSKIRRKATPFGFGFDMTTLTGRQSAILGALGISRVPRK